MSTDSIKPNPHYDSSQQYRTKEGYLVFGRTGAVSEEAKEEAKKANQNEQADEKPVEIHTQEVNPTEVVKDEPRRKSRSSSRKQAKSNKESK